MEVNTSSVNNQCSSLSVFNENFGMGMDFDQLRGQFKEWVEKQSTSYPVTTCNDSEAIVKSLNDKFEVTLDVCQFKSEEITIKIIGSNTICIEGAHEEQHSDSGFLSRHFIRKYTIPNGYDIQNAVSSLSSDGTLRIIAPRSGQTMDDYRNVAIQQSSASLQNTNQQRQSHQQTENKVSSSQTTKQFEETHNYIREFLHNVDNKCRVVPIQQVGPFSSEHLEESSAKTLNTQKRQECYTKQNEYHTVPIQQSSTTYTSSVESKTSQRPDSQYSNIPINQTKECEVINEHSVNKSKNRTEETNIQKEIVHEYRTVPIQQTGTQSQNTKNVTEFSKTLNWETNENSQQYKTVPIQQTTVSTKQTKVQQKTKTTENDKQSNENCNYKTIQIQQMGVNSQDNKNETHNRMTTSRITDDVRNTEDFEQKDSRKCQGRTITSQENSQTNEEYVKQESYKTIPIKQIGTVEQEVTSETVTQKSIKNLTGVEIPQDVNPNSNKPGVPQEPRIVPIECTQAGKDSSNIMKKIQSVEEVEIWEVSNQQGRKTIPSKQTQVKNSSIDSQTQCNVNETENFVNVLQEQRSTSNNQQRRQSNTDINSKFVQDKTYVSEEQHNRTYKTVPIKQIGTTLQEVTSETTTQKGYTDNVKNLTKVDATPNSNKPGAPQEPRIVPIECTQTGTKDSNNVMKKIQSVEEVEIWEISNQQGRKTIPSKQTQVKNSSIDLQTECNVNETESFVNVSHEQRSTSNNQQRRQSNTDINSKLVQDETYVSDEQHNRTYKTVPIKQIGTISQEVTSETITEKRFTDNIKNLTDVDVNPNSNKPATAQEPRIVPIEHTPAGTKDSSNIMKKIQSVEEVEIWEVSNQHGRKTDSVSQIDKNESHAQQFVKTSSVDSQTECSVNETESFVKVSQEQISNSNNQQWRQSNIDNNSKLVQDETDVSEEQHTHTYKTVPIQQTGTVSQKITNEIITENVSTNFQGDTKNITKETETSTVTSQKPSGITLDDANKTNNTMKKIEEIEICEIRNRQGCTTVPESVTQTNKEGRFLKNISIDSQTSEYNRFESDSQEHKTSSMHKETTTARTAHQQNSVELLDEYSTNYKTIPTEQTGTVRKTTTQETYEQKIVKRNSIDSQCSNKTDLEERKNWECNTNESQKISKDYETTVSYNKNTSAMKNLLQSEGTETHSSKKTELDKDSSFKSYSQETKKDQSSSGTTKSLKSNTTKQNDELTTTNTEGQEHNVIFQESDFSKKDIAGDNFKKSIFTNKNAKAECVTYPEGFKISNQQTVYSKQTKTEWNSNQAGGKLVEPSSLENNHAYQVQFSVESNNSEQFGRVPSEAGSGVCIEDVTEENESKNHSSSGYRRHETSQVVSNTEHTVHVQRK